MSKCREHKVLKLTPARIKYIVRAKDGETAKAQPDASRRGIESCKLNLFLSRMESNFNSTRQI
jgi:hypothetical protein